MRGNVWMYNRQYPTKGDVMKKVLVADDDVAILEVMKIILEENGYMVKAVSDGAIVKEEILRFRPDLLLLDIWMSGYDGRDISKQLREDNNTKDLPIIVVSAHNETEKIAKEAGTTDFLSKPFDIDDLLHKVKKYVQ